MRNRMLISLLAAAGVSAAIAHASLTNLGPAGEPAFTGHVLSGAAGPGVRVLYAPSEADDPGYRAALAARLGDGTIVDYYAAHFGTPDPALLAAYDCVMTWANYAYSNSVLFGNNLADFVDQGGSVVLGAFCAYTAGNYLSGRIMADPAYCPVRGGFNHFAFAVWSGDGAAYCAHSGVAFYGATYRDILTLDGTGAYAPGHFTDGEISVAHNPALSVTYANGAGGFPIDGGAPDFDLVVANVCFCSGPVGSESRTWGAIKELYR